MSFSVSTCITNTGTQPLSASLQIFSNPVNLYNSGTFVQNVSTSLITGANCPYTFTVPNGTVNIRILDPTTLCYVDMPVSDTDVCTTCELGLNNVNNNLLGQINVGVLTGNCDNSISDYVINWYGPDSTSNLAFTSGQGTVFTGQYQYSHPITTTNSPVLNPGVYVGKITKVDLNGAKLSSTSGTGNILSPTLTDCPTNINVTTYDCTNGSTYLTYYNHYRNFIYNGSVAPSTLNTKLKLNDANKKYVIFAFQGNSVPDKIKFTLNGSAYQTPIQLEECNVGNTGVDNFTPTTWPKQINTTTFFKKILNLTGLTINNNDIIDITITPNSGTSETNWSLYFGCSTRPTGSKTCLDSYKNSPYKIVTSSIARNTNTSSCPIVYQVSFDVSGCSTSQNSTWFNSSLNQLALTTTQNFGSFSTSDTNNKSTLTFGSFYNEYLNITLYFIVNGSTSCQSTVGTNYRVEKVAGNDPSLNYYFHNLTDLNIINNSFWSTKNTTTTHNNGNGPYSTNSGDIDYYRYMNVRIQTNDICGDGTSNTTLRIPVNSTLLSGSTSYLGYSYFLKISLPIQTYNSSACPPGYCNCANLSANTINLNTAITGTTFQYTTTKILKDSFYQSFFNSPVTNPGNYEINRDGRSRSTYLYGDVTYPSSGGTNYNNSLLPSLPNGSTTWDWENHYSISSNILTQYVYYYTVKLKTPLTNPFQYEIYGYTISNFGLGTYSKIYDSVTGIVSGKESFFV